MSTDSEGSTPQTGPHEATTPRFRPTRRQAIAGAGIVVGGAALAASPLLSALFASLSAAMEPRVGLVVPVASRFPGLGGQLRDGVVSGLAAAGGRSTHVMVREVGSAPSAVAEAARGLVERDRVDIVLAWANPARVSALGDLSRETHTPVVVLDPGTQVVTARDGDRSVLRHSLGAWQSAWSLGGWSAAHMGRRCFIASSLYESGFDSYHAFVHGFERAGGQVVGCGVTGVADGDTETLLSRVAGSRADFIMSFHSGADASAFASAFAEHSPASGRRLAMSGFAVPALLAQGSRLPRDGVVTCLGWPAGEAGSLAAGPFFTLAHDVGALVAQAAVDGPRAMPSGSTAIESRRGHLTVDLTRGLSDVPLAIHALGGGSRVEKLADAGRTTDAEAFAAAVLPSPRTGWLDVYGSAT